MNSVFRSLGSQLGFFSKICIQYYSAVPVAGIRITYIKLQICQYHTQNQKFLAFENLWFRGFRPQFIGYLFGSGSSDRLQKRQFNCLVQVSNFRKSIQVHHWVNPVGSEFLPVTCFRNNLHSTGFW